MHVEKPTASFILSLIGGTLILIVGLVIAIVLAVGPQSGPGSNEISFGLSGVSFASLTASGLWFGLGVVYFLVFGVGFGSLVVFGAVMIYQRPKQHVTWGVIVLLFSLGSVFSTGGLVVGLVLGMVGGVLGIVWKPSRRAAPPVPVLS